jgi:serine/threonine-protein kinase RsbW
VPSALHPSDPLGNFDHDLPADHVIPSDQDEARKIQLEIERQLTLLAYTDKEIFAIKLALEEAVVNAIKHGNQMDRGKRVRIAYRVHAERFDALIADEGAGFDPNEVPDPTAPENLERPCGRGLMLIRHYMTEVTYNDRGNLVRMSKVRHGCC